MLVLYTSLYCYTYIYVHFLILLSFLLSLSVSLSISLSLPFSPSFPPLSVHLYPLAVVQRIRTAPSPSTFVIGEDEALRQQVLALLRKQERRAAAKRALAQAQGEGGGGGGGGGETGEHISHGKKPSISSIPGEERRKKREK